MPFMLLAVALAAADPPADAAKARQNQAKTFDVTVRVTEVVAVNGASNMPTVRTGKGVPEVETTLESTDRIVFDGAKHRVEYNHPGWEIAGGPGRPKPTTIAHVMDGDRCGTNFHFPANGRPFGYVSGPSTQFSAGERFFAPVLAHYRGAARLANLTPTDRREVIAGRECVEYAGRGVDRYWFDPAAGYALVREVNRGQTRDGYRIDIEHGPDGPVRWVKTVTTSTGRLRSTTTVQVVRTTVNEPVPAATFALPFPPGGQVTDDRLPTGTWNQFVVADDGSLTPLPDPNPPTVWDRAFVRKLMIAATVLVVGAMVVWGLWRAWRRVRG